ncbi:MAG: hypothetical protein HGB12_15760, partial [Bacteroidetes bacterium]|nr:hypothetical protein [Bacteroidota bacterium]
MKHIYLIFGAALLSGLSGFGQGTNDTIHHEKFGITFSGFVRTEAAFDTRQGEGYRDQLINLYPANIRLDKNGDDVNARPGFDQYAMTTRLTGNITGPSAFGAKSMACMEGDFTGPSNTENNAFRLRHAYIKLNWAKSELFMGQYWHPLNLPEMIPSVISLNTGAPFHPFSRQPQIRFSRLFGKINVVAVASSERDNTSIGPLGSTSEYLRNSVIPNMHLQIQYKNEEKLF